MWDHAELLPWIEWFIEDHRLVTVSRNDELIGLCTGRLLVAPEAHMDFYAHNEHAGTLLWVDLFISKDKHVAKIICDAFLKRFGRMDALGFCREERFSKEPRFHDFNRWERIMRYGI